MKKIIILAIALLSTGIVFSETVLRKDTAKPAIVKIDKNATTEHSVANDAIATAD